MLNSSRQLFGYTKDDLAVETLTLDNGILSCDIITFGAALRSLRVPDRSGIKRDVVLGYDSLIHIMLTANSTSMATIFIIIPT